VLECCSELQGPQQGTALVEDSEVVQHGGATGLRPVDAARQSAGYNIALLRSYKSR
jgi:hypothetical protein